VDGQSTEAATYGERCAGELPGGGIAAAGVGQGVGARRGVEAVDVDVLDGAEEFVPGLVARGALLAVVGEGAFLLDGAVQLVGDDGVVPRVVRQAAVVGARVDGCVADHDALEVDPVLLVVRLLVPLHDLRRQLRDVVP
jgi:hypothetical protein